MKKKIFPEKLWRNRNLKISKALLKSQVHQGTSLFTSAASNQYSPSIVRGKLRSGYRNHRIYQGVVQRIVHGKLRSDFQLVRGETVVVKVS